jgi:hypothetical protein
MAYLGPDVNLRSSEGGFVAARKKKSQKKASSASTRPKLTKKQYEANFNDVSATISNALKAVERLKLDLIRIEPKLKCFCHGDPMCPVFGARCSTHRDH